MIFRLDLVVGFGGRCTAGRRFLHCVSVISLSVSEHDGVKKCCTQRQKTESEIKEREIPGAQDGDASHAAHNKIYPPTSRLGNYTTWNALFVLRNMNSFMYSASVKSPHDDIQRYHSSPLTERDGLTQTTRSKKFNSFFIFNMMGSEIR
jgi:hypothetical protein